MRGLILRITITCQVLHFGGRLRWMRYLSDAKQRRNFIHQRRLMGPNNVGLSSSPSGFWSFDSARLYPRYVTETDQSLHPKRPPANTSLIIPNGCANLTFVLLSNARSKVRPTRVFTLSRANSFIRRLYSSGRAEIGRPKTRKYYCPVETKRRWREGPYWSSSQTETKHRCHEGPFPNSIPNDKWLSRFKLT